MRLAACLNSTSISPGRASGLTLLALAIKERKAVRWSMASAAITPRESETRSRPFLFPDVLPVGMGNPNGTCRATPLRHARPAAKQTPDVVQLPDRGRLALLRGTARTSASIF